MLRGKKGFTLIELMIVVAIIGILAAIAIPNFLKFQAKSKQSEAKTNLKGIYTAETSYFGENNQYSSFDNVTWVPVGAARYHYTLDGKSTGVDALNKGVDYTSTAPTWDATGADGFKGAAPDVTTGAFTAGAVGNVDNDADPDTWEINDANSLHNIQNDV